MELTTQIEFKSLQEFYEKEVSGIKPNTTRVMSKEEDAIITKLINTIKYIRIVSMCTVGRTRSFTAKLKDITRFESRGQIIYIFSW